MELQRVAGIMGYGAVKYADLKNHRMTNYKFSFEDMLTLKGNTAVYLEYAHARIAGERVYVIFGSEDVLSVKGVHKFVSQTVGSSKSMGQSNDPFPS